MVTTKILIQTGAGILLAMTSIVIPSVIAYSREIQLTTLKSQNSVQEIPENIKQLQNQIQELQTKIKLYDQKEQELLQISTENQQKINS